MMLISTAAGRERPVLIGIEALMLLVQPQRLQATKIKIHIMP